MSLQYSVYHSLLRIASLTIALVLLFESGLISHSTKQLSDNARSYVANAVGVQATVTPTELNQLTADLTAQKNELARREAALQEREIAVGLNGGATANSELSTFMLSAILFILLVLIVLNYILDYFRSSRTSQLKFSHE